MRRSTLAVLLALFAGIAAGASAQAPDIDRSGWDRVAAAKYLDDRMDAWFTNATKLRTGDGKTACVSCHTPLPYALARPALRHAMRVSAATSEETRLLDETARRVGTSGTHQLLNESGDAKKAESRGTEAVLNAVILASADAAVSWPAKGPTRTRKRVSPPTCVGATSTGAMPPSSDRALSALSSLLNEPA